MAIAALALAAGPAAAAAPPVPVIGAVSDVQGASAHLSGEVDPADHYTYWGYQYSTDGTSWSPFPFQGEVAEGSGFQPAPADLTGLKPGTKYFVRLAAVNFEDSFPDSSEAVSSSLEFTTNAVAAPTVSIDSAANVTNNTAEVSGSVQRTGPLGDPAVDADCRFEYISAASYLGRSENQRLRVTATGGTFTLSFANPAGEPAQATAPIAFDASAAIVQAALQGLANVGPGAVTVSGGPGSPSGSSPYTLSFNGSLAGKNVEQIGADGSALTGPAPAAQAETTTPGHTEGFEGADEKKCKPNPITAGGATSVTATLTGLKANTTYHLRLTASNAGGSESKEAANFETTSTIFVQTLAAIVQGTSVKLGGSLNQANAPLTYQFQWGTSAAYGNAIPAAPEQLSFLDESFHTVTEQLAGLTPGTVYHYQVVATNTQTGEVAKGADRTFIPTSIVPPAGECPNEASRVGLSAGLPDCRAYEFASLGLNQAEIYLSDIIAAEQESAASSRIKPVMVLRGKGVAEDGSAIMFSSTDPPDKALSGWVAGNIVARRSPAGGWLPTEEINPKITEPFTSFTGLGGPLRVVSRDYSEAVLITSQPLVPGAPSGTNYYFRHADGSFELMTKAGGPYLTSIAQSGVDATSADFTHIFFHPIVKQGPEDPTTGFNAYEWDNGKLNLVGILPGSGKVPAPDGAKIAVGRIGSPVSADGSRALFQANGLPGLYLRIDNQETVKVSTSQRSGDPDPESAQVTPVAINADGSEVLFMSSSELTDDANTGETGGVPNKSGNDLYSYDVSTGKLTDLTVGSNPADKAKGANVVLAVGSSPDFSYLYFIARGALAPGAVSGEKNLYVAHEGETTYIGSGLVGSNETGVPFDVTPNGRQIVFLSSANLTAYDSGGKTEVYKYTYQGALECASCRPSGEPPTSTNAGFVQNAISDDGSRVFFTSDDAVIPEASSGLQNVFEYEGGEVHLLSPGDGAAAYPLGASASGDDFFFATTDELAQRDERSKYGIYDVRVNADVAPPPAPVGCQGENCRGAGTSPFNAPSPGTTRFEAPGRVSAPGSKAVKGAKLQLRIVAPGPGDITVSGKGLKPAKAKASKAGPVTVTLALKPAANKARKKKGVYKTRFEILFKSSSGDASRADASLKFEANAKKKGGK